MTQKQKTAIRTVVSTYFKDQDGRPFDFTDGQCEIFGAVINPDHKFVWLSAPTRYGKSNILALALIYLAVFHNLKIPIVAGTKDKADKIMEYIVKHIADHPELYAGLINLESIEKVEKLKIQASKQALRWSGGGWIYVTSVDSRNISKEGEGVVGEGGDIVVLEEAGLIKHQEQFSKIVRMTEHNRGWGKLIQSGNCIEGSVFEKAFNDPKYIKVRIGLDQAVKEGRFTQEELDTKKQDTTTKDWKRYYLVEFPAKGEFAYFKPRKYEFLPHNLKYYGAVDLALGESTKGSLTGIVVGAIDEHGQAYEIESIGQQMSPDELIRLVFNLPYTFERFGIEQVQFQKYFLNVIEQKSKEMGLYIPFVGISQEKKKEERIESIEPLVNTGQVLVKGDNILYEHLQDYPNVDKLDVLDTFEMCLRVMGLAGYDPRKQSGRIII